MSAQPTKQQVVATLRALKPELEAVYHMKSVSFDEMPSLLRFIEMEDFLSDFLQMKVGLVMEEALKPEIGRRIRQETVSV